MKDITSEQELVSIDPFENIEKCAQLLAKDIALILKKEVIELHIFSHVFRTALERSIQRILLASKRNPQAIAMYPETIPGFTLMLFRRPDELNNVEALQNSQNEPTLENNAEESNALNSVIGNFCEKNGNKIMVIEYLNVIFALFPIEDTRENLKKMEMYFVE